MCVGAAPDPDRGGSTTTACHRCSIQMRRPLSVRGGQPVRGTPQQRWPSGCLGVDSPAGMRRRTRYAVWISRPTYRTQPARADARWRLARSAPYTPHADPGDNVRMPSGGPWPSRPTPHPLWSVTSAMPTINISTERGLRESVATLQSAWIHRARKCNGLDGHSFSCITARRARRIGCAAQITAHIWPYNRFENNSKKYLSANLLYSVQHTHVIWLDMAWVGKCVHVVWALSYDGAYSYLPLARFKPGYFSVPICASTTGARILDFQGCLIVSHFYFQPHTISLALVSGTKFHTL